MSGGREERFPEIGVYIVLKMKPKINWLRKNSNFFHKALNPDLRIGRRVHSPILRHTI